MQWNCFKWNSWAAGNSEGKGKREKNAGGRIRGALVETVQPLLQYRQWRLPKVHVQWACVEHKDVRSGFVIEVAMEPTVSSVKAQMVMTGYRWIE